MQLINAELCPEHMKQLLNVKWKTYKIKQVRDFLNYSYLLIFSDGRTVEAATFIRIKVMYMFLYYSHISTSINIIYVFREQMCDFKYSLNYF